jgi:hypothetical protein
MAEIAYSHASGQSHLPEMIMGRNWETNTINTSCTTERQGRDFLLSFMFPP